MADLLTWDEVEAAISAPRSEHQIREFATIRALSQKLADTPCPECHTGDNTKIYSDNWEVGCAGELPTKCPHCGDFPRDRRGYFAIDAEDALRRVPEMGKEE